MPKIIHQRKECIGCGACVTVCPKFFEIDKRDNLATLKNSKKIGDNFEVNTDGIACLKEAAEICPVKIIKIENN